MRAKLSSSLILRLAIVTNVTKTYVECEYIGHAAEQKFQCPISQPYVSNGGGILTGIEVGAMVVVGNIPPNRKIIVAYVPIRREYFDQNLQDLPDTPYYATPLPTLEGGEIMLKSSKSGSFIDLSPDGNLILDASAGSDEGDLELSPRTRTFFVRTDNVYSFTEAGRTIEGVVKRDKNKKELIDSTKTINFLSGETYEDLLSTIGRSPTDEVQSRTTTVVREFIRNPALVEKRHVTYEYGDSFGVRQVSTEARAMLSMDNAEGIDHLTTRAGARDKRRTDALNLGMFNYNHLIEKIEGTVVDIYGNVLDINRNIINIPDVSTLDTKNGSSKDLKTLYRYMRRSVKYHMEINSRKEIDGDEPSRRPSDADKYAREHSRWSIDVDGEGLTKINIPASSNTGNIPIPTRHVTTVPTDNRGNPDTEERDSGSFKSQDQTDVKSIPFGQETQEVPNSEYQPKTADGGNISTAGTVYHDLMSIAPLIFDSGKFGSSVGPVMSSSINNSISGSDANAGGKSVHANLDGSLEMSIGADTIDNKSVLLDLQGAMISHFGKDKNGRSIIHQSDGDMIIQIGGDGIDDTGFRPGRLEIHLARQGGSPQKIIVDEQGITIDVEGNALFSASGDMTLGAGGRLLLAGELIFNYGSFDDAVDGTRAPKGTERLVLRNGIPDHM